MEKRDRMKAFAFVGLILGYIIGIFVFAALEWPAGKNFGMWNGFIGGFIGAAILGLVGLGIGSLGTRVPNEIPIPRDDYPPRPPDKSKERIRTHHPIFGDLDIAPPPPPNPRPPDR